MNWVRNYFHQIQILVFFVCSFAIFGVFQFLSNQISNRDVSEYLVSLRNENPTGCLSFYEKKNDILVLGDSHSYTAIDYYKLSQLTGSTKISSCTLGGLYFDSLVKLVEKLPSFESLPTNIIYGMSLRQFTTGSDRELQLKEHSKIIDAMSPSPEKTFLKIKRNLEVFVKEFSSRDTLLTHRQRDLDYWQPVLSQLNYADVEMVYEKLPHAAKDNWHKYMLQLRFLESNEVNIKRFCDVILKNNINLFLIDLPESPYLQKMYKAEFLVAYDKAIHQLSACSKNVVRLNHKEWGIDGRHFLNRSLNKKFDFNELSQKLDQAPTDIKVLAFDLDHPNLIGAQIITEKIYQQIEGELKYAF